jgi:hypothetical protein
MTQTTRSDAARDPWLHAMLTALLCCVSACAESTKLSTIKVAGREVTDARHVHVERDQKPLQAAPDMTLQPGDTISTDADTTLVIRMAEARAILMPSTRVSLGSIWTWFGRVFISGWWQGKTKLVTAAVKGTQYVIEVDEKSELTTISVLEGTVGISSVAHLFPDVVLTDAQRVRVAVDLAGSPRAEPIERSEYNSLIDASNRARDPVLDQLLLPDMKDVPVKDAELQLRHAGFEVSRREALAPSREAVGLVTGQSPKPGTAARRVELQVGRSFRKGVDKAQIIAPSQVAAGATFALSWSGPNLDGDKIEIGPSGTSDAVHFTGPSLDARDGRGELRAPAEAGQYELRFSTEEGGGSVLARATLTVTPLGASLKLRASAAAGSMVEVTWRGPNRKDDLISLVPVGTPDGVIQDATTLSAEAGHGSLHAPAVAGEYELRYALAGPVFKGAVILARSRLTVTSVQAQLTAPATCEAGASFDVVWQGPNGPLDAIHLVPVGTPDSRYFPELTLTAAAGQGRLRAPADPGEYELRYALAGTAASGALQAGSAVATMAVIARSKITVSPVMARFRASSTARADSELNFSWSGPNRTDDQVLLVPIDKPDSAYLVGFTISAESGSGALRTPKEPGEYELRYRLAGVRLSGDAIIGRAKIRIVR